MPILTLAEAFSRIIDNVRPAPIERVPLGAALGQYLAADIPADRDFPPFHRSMVDGYAVFSSDTRAAPDVLEVIDEVPAGTSAVRALSPGQAIKIMTGAPVPAGADAVLMREHAEALPGGFVRVAAQVKAGQNVARRASDTPAGAPVLTAGQRLGAGEIGILAAVGWVAVPVRPLPDVAILGTGDELVEPDATPGPSQIRNSNSAQLLAQCAEQRLCARYLGIAPDDAAQTRALIADGLRAGLFVSTGGVSVGDRDYVGASFRELGVQVFFDKVQIKPGKPTTFGIYREGARETLVFGLPGNPVAAWVSFKLFVLTAVRVRCGARNPLPEWLQLPLLESAVQPETGRQSFRPCKLVNHEGQTKVAPIDWHGSGHLTALAGATGLFAQPTSTDVPAGNRVTYYPC